VSDVTLAWLFLFGLTSGPRLTETGQAETSDVVTQGQIRAIQITDEAAETPDGDDVGKSVKTESSKRYIIVSPMLIKLGFNKFLAALERAEATPLFIDLWRQGGPSTKEASRLLNRRIRQVTDRRHLCYHSLRHTWKAAARDANINPVIERQLSGHAPRDESEKYGAAYLPILAKHAARLKFRMVDWEALAVAWETIDWDLVVQRLIGASAQPRVRRAA
jgi:integrase